MGFWLLLEVKVRLLARSFLGRSAGQTVLALLVMAAVLVPSWLGLGGAARDAVDRHGTQGAVAVLGAVHLGWLFSAFLFSAFAEGFELRRVQRYPIRPSTVFVMNVLLAPIDLVALFLLPPLVTAAVAMGRAAGPAAALGMAAACLATVLTTGVLLHILLAALGRFLHREWSRAAAGLLFGLAFAAPALAFNRHVTGGGGWDVTAAAVDRVVPAAAALANRLPTTAFPALVARAAAEGRPGALVLGIVGTALVLLAGVALGARWATAAALAGEAAAPARPRAATTDAAAPSRWERLLGPDIAVLTARELRYWLRTPQVMLGLLFTPVLVCFFFTERQLSLDLRLFFLPFFCLVSVFNVSANQFGLDREGVRLLFLLPVEPRRLIAAKNLASFTVVTGSLVASLAVVLLVGGAPLAELGVPVLSVLATIPAVLMAGNALSVRHPWRMTFRVGGMPPGALASAFIQFLVVAGMGLMLAVPALVGRLVGGRFVPLAGTAALGLVAWLAWTWSLGRAARGLVERREQLLATLAHPHESG